MNTTTPSARNGPPKHRPRPGQTLVEFSLTLPLLLLLLFGIIEFGRIFQAWVTLQNAARAAARVAITGEYDKDMFPDLDKTWSPGANGPTFTTWTNWDNDTNHASTAYSKDGVPCPFTAQGAPYGFFRNHWGFDCDPQSDDHSWMRKDIMRLIAINKAAQVGAAGLALGTDPNTKQIWMDIPGTEPTLDSGTDPYTGVNAGIGAQHYADGLNSADITKYASEPNTSLLHLSETQRAWFHVFICSTRLSVRGEVKATVMLSRVTRKSQISRRPLAARSIRSSRAVWSMKAKLAPVT